MGLGHNANRNELSMSWQDICALDEIPQLGSRVVTTELGEVAIFRTALDELFAIDDSCPHRGGPLSQGIVFDKRVACPLHDWVIDLEAGCAVGPDEGCVRRHDVQVENGRVQLKLVRETLAA